MSDEIRSSEEIDALIDHHAGKIKNTTETGQETNKPPPARDLEPLYREHPQTVALFLAALKPETAALLLAKLDYALQFDVAFRIARLEITASARSAVPEILTGLARQLEPSLVLDPLHDRNPGFPSGSGTALLCEILKKLHYGIRRRILLELTDQEPRSAFQIKMHVYLFDDLQYCTDETLGKILECAAPDDLASAMRAVSETFVQKIYSVLAKEKAQALREMLEWSGAVEMRLIEDAQEKIVLRSEFLAQQGLCDPTAEFEEYAQRHFAE